MKIKITNHQLDILTENFCFVGNKLKESKNIISENGMTGYLITMNFSGRRFKIIIYSHNGASALQVAAKLFRGAMVTGEFKAV